MRLLLSRIAGSFIQMEVALDPAGVWVSVDSDKVEQLLLSLVVRASDAMPLGGKLVVTTRRWRLAGPYRHAYGVVPAGRWATLRVTDTGSWFEGLATAQMTGSMTGTAEAVAAGGADLAKVVSIVRRVGGHLLVEEGKPTGTEVVVCLPAKDSPTRPSRASDSTPAILVVEGDAWMQTTTAHVLRRAGYGVLQADHASGALELLRGVTGSCIRVMLVDLDLAGDDARLLSRAAQNLKPDLQVIYVGHARAGSSDDLLTKPFTADELLLAVARRLGALSPS